MKIIISYPPINSGKGYPTLGQNRQFQFFKEPTYIYPIVPAIAATLLKQTGHQVIWNDCIAEGLNYGEFLKIIQDEKPDLIILETKTPVVKHHWKIITDLKKVSSGIWPLKIALTGDHVTALPEESFRHSEVDFVLTGGDYDFLLLNLCNYLSSSANQLKSSLAPGIYYRDGGQIKNTGRFNLDNNLDSLPFIDRDLTKWRLYAYKNGNYKLTPGTYIMSGRDCWWGKCSFCSWPTLYPKFRTRTVTNVLDEIGMLIEKYGIREIMDDTGSFPIGDWLNDFCNGIISREYNKKLYIDCNMRFGALSLRDFILMKKANFRLLLFGLESANQATLDRLNKNIKVEQIIKDCKSARKAGLYPHITIMFGYPWESYAEAKKTLKLGRWLLRKGLAYTVQATIAIPYPGTLLFDECNEKKLLETSEWERFDMKEPVMKAPFNKNCLTKLVRGIYSVAFNPEFIYNRLMSIRDLNDILYFTRAGKKIFGHIKDFSISAFRNN